MNSSGKRTTIFLILVGILFVFSILSIVFSFDSLIKDIVYSVGFFIAIILSIYYRKQAKQEREQNKE
ncbi:hypothetical protein CR194_05110 [Salipaludibacillus keqinensis]|uniref:Uncharacterized protein n=1 Tax=Salipaludibacillus keqinensis TaxID=2045207 RepID=A0A323TQW5_9BACI|nr:hypothetical protein CR194_05110 [Salipaludibacillus keqinensis]